MNNFSGVQTINFFLWMTCRFFFWKNGEFKSLQDTKRAPLISQIQNTKLSFFLLCFQIFIHSLYHLKCCVIIYMYQKSLLCHTLTSEFLTHLIIQLHSNRRHISEIFFISFHFFHAANHKHFYGNSRLAIVHWVIFLTTL
jgi:hypothetical protein